MVIVLGAIIEMPDWIGARIATIFLGDDQGRVNAWSIVVISSRRKLLSALSSDIRSLMTV